METETPHNGEEDKSEDESGTVYFELPVLGKLDPRLANDVCNIDLFLKKGDADYEISSSFGASVPVFETQEKANAWYNRTVDIFSAHVSMALTAALRLLIMDAGRLALYEAKLMPYGLKAILRDHLSFEELIVRDRWKMETGRPRKWAATDLTTVISEAMNNLKKAKRTYPGVAEYLQKKYPERAPKNGESLRKMVRDLEIPWMELKKEAQKRS
ncbi:MAG TPA: hypothetical protein VGN95_25310 [Pyrinomonadaceae bacterium]|nr:hypothetical protein [Pyrinomonadaceae bacterium]